MIGALLAAFAFLTRLPVPARLPTERELGHSVAFFPLVGGVLGLIAAGLCYGLAGRMAALLIGVVVVAALALITGGLHLDGLADLFDGLGGGRGDARRTLEIMRDSAIGAHGAAALVLVLLAKVVALAVLIDARDFAALLAFPVLARWAVTAQVVWFPYAREEGLGRAFRQGAGLPQVLIATAFVAVLVLVVGRSAVTMAGIVLAVALLLGLWLRARLGGLTGDVYGATIEICEAVALVAAGMR